MAGPAKRASRYCIVPGCKNSTNNAPDKVYFYVPQDIKIRKKWFKVMRRNQISLLSCVYCCEDHFNIEEDTENYIQYKIMPLQEGHKTTLRLKKGVMPHIFQCHKVNKVNPPERKGALKRKRLALVEEALSEYAKKQCVTGQKIIESLQSNYCEAGPSTSSTHDLITLSSHQPSTSSSHGPSTSSIHLNIVDTNNKVLCKVEPCFSPSNLSSKEILKADKAIQVNIKAKYRSKGVNVNFSVKKKDIKLSPFHLPSKDITTSAIKSVQTSHKKRKLFCDNSVDSVSITSKSSTASIDYEPDGSSSESSLLKEDDIDTDKQLKNLMRSGILSAIEREPKMLLGLPKRSFHLIKLLSDNIPLPIIDILITLKKIKLNESFSILALKFGYAQSTISSIFSKSIVTIAEKMQDLIVWPTPTEIFKNLPRSFRAPRYANVVSIIDCLEIKIENHRYKKCNTLKYLISCTPDGLVNFISDGYSGKATDEIIVEDCGFLECLPPNKAVMAHRGFKDLSRLVENKNCTLVRPPSVSKSIPSTKEDVKQSKRIAALRIRVECVINRLREFHMLLPCACVDHNLIPVMDKVIVVACGLINYTRCVRHC